MRSLVRLTATALTATLAATAAADTFHGINAGAPVWNDTIFFTPGRAQAIAATGTNAIRINFRLDGHTSWEPSLLAQYDQIIDNAVNAGFEVLGLWSNETTIGTQAQWNASTGRGGSPNAYAQSFASNAAFLADRYADKIKRWEVWNEPDAWAQPPSVVGAANAGGTYLTPARFADLLATTYEALDDHNGTSLLDTHNIELVTGGLLAHDIGGSFTTGRTYMSGVYNHSIWSAFEAEHNQPYAWDYLGWHFYISPGQNLQGAYLQSYLNDLRAGQLQAGDTTPVVVTEFGWNTRGIDPQIAADNMATAYDTLEANPWVDSSFWYQWTDEAAGDWGIMDFNASNPKPAYFTFSEYNAPDPVPGDLNADGQLNAADIHILVQNFGNPAYDLNQNGLTNLQDLNFWITTVFGSAPGDADLNHTVDLLDLSALAANFNTPGSWEQGDFNGDGFVNLNDLSILAAHFGYTTPIPEPSSCLMLLTAFAACLPRSNPLAKR